ncbi:amidase [Comamonas serinivorans]|uniref:amidase n=1 Tax=Comamonas serinivorans TaxID=1082851 RepID=UPI003AADDB60
MLDLADWSVHELTQAYAAHQLSPVAVMQAVLQRADALEPQLHALWLLRPDAALAAARASEARWLRGEPLGPLDGVPVTLKDNIATQGDPTPLGTRATPDVPAAHDAPPAARLREAGAIAFAKTTMPDWGMLSSGLSTYHALARNPWDLSRGPGGSSSGAGAAAAAGYGPLHIGTDIGGSIRLPGTWCGVVGFKPSLGRVPIDPPFMGRCAGPLTRTVADAAAAMAVLSLPDRRDSMGLPAQDLPWIACTAQPEANLGWLRGKRIGLWLEAGCGLPLDPEVRAATEDAARRLAAAGAHIEPVAPLMTPAMLAGMDRFWRMRSLQDVQALSPAQREALLPYILTWAESARELTGAEVYQAWLQNHLMRQASVQAMAGLDFIVSPTAPITAFAAELPTPTNDPLRGLEHIGFTLPFNMGEQPAVSVNAGYSRAGLPIGLQIAGQRFDDLGVLRLAQAFELLREPQRPWPMA